MIQLLPPLGESKHVGDRSEGAEAQADKQRRKKQNRRNQRAHRESVLHCHGPPALPSLC